MYQRMPTQTLCVPVPAPAPAHQPQLYRGVNDRRRWRQCLLSSTAASSPPKPPFPTNGCPCMSSKSSNHIPIFIPHTHTHTHTHTHIIYTYMPTPQAQTHTNYYMHMCHTQTSSRINDMAVRTCLYLGVRAGELPDANLQYNTGKEIRKTATLRRIGKRMCNQIISQSHKP